MISEGCVQWNPVYNSKDLPKGGTGTQDYCISRLALKLLGYRAPYVHLKILLRQNDVTLYNVTEIVTYCQRRHQLFLCALNSDLVQTRTRKFYIV